MSATVAQTIEVKVERLIPAPPADVFDAWLSAEIPGTIWNAAAKFLIDPRVDGLFYWRMDGKVTPHYGRFIQMQRPQRLQHTWVSPNTLGEESIVTVTFKDRNGDTLMTLLHSNLPDTDLGRRHQDGWTHFIAIFEQTMRTKVA